MSSLVTVIIPVYNRELEIKRSVESVLRQGIDIDLVIVDDGSTDNTASICDEYARNYENITVIHTSNGGVSQARNIGLDHVNTKYLMFLDSDDELADNAVRNLVEAADDNSADMVIGRIQARTLEGETRNFVIPDKFNNTIISEREFWELANYPGIYMGVAVVIKLYRSTVWKDIRFPVGVKRHEDEYMIHKYVGNCDIIYSLDKVTYIQYFHKVDAGLSSGRFTFVDLFGSRCRVERCEYLINKKIYDAALDTFGFGTRILIQGDRTLHDEASKKEVRDLNKEYKRLAKELIPNVGFANKIRLFLFCINLRLYGRVREILR